MHNNIKKWLPIGIYADVFDSSPALINNTYISRRSNDQALRQTEIYTLYKSAVRYIFYIAKRLL